MMVGDIRGEPVQPGWQYQETGALDGRPVVVPVRLTRRPGTFKVVLDREKDDAARTSKRQTDEIDRKERLRPYRQRHPQPEGKQDQVVSGHMPVFLGRSPIAAFKILHDGAHGRTGAGQLLLQNMAHQGDRTLEPGIARIENQVEKPANRCKRNVPGDLVQALLIFGQRLVFFKGQCRERAPVLVPVAIGGVVERMVPGPDVLRHAAQDAEEKAGDLVVLRRCEQRVVSALVHQYKYSEQEQADDQPAKGRQPVGYGQACNRKVPEDAVGDERRGQLNGCGAVTFCGITGDNAFFLVYQLLCMVHALPLFG